MSNNNVYFTRPRICINYLSFPSNYSKYVTEETEDRGKYNSSKKEEDRGKFGRDRRNIRGKLE